MRCVQVNVQASPAASVVAVQSTAVFAASLAASVPASHNASSMPAGLVAEKSSGASPVLLTRIE